MTADGLPLEAQTRRLHRWLMVGAVILLCSVPFFRSYQNRDRLLGEDEIYWVGQAYYFHLAFEQRDWSHPDWQLLPARENPPLGKYLIGMGLWLDGLSVTNADWLGVFYVIAKDRPNAWGEGRDRAERQAVLDQMQPAVRELVVNQDRFEYPIQFATTARAVMLVFGALAIVGVFVLAMLYMKPLAAFLAALLFALHPAVVAAYTEVGADVLALCFSVLTVIHFALIERRVWQRCSRPSLCRAAVCLGGGLCLAFAVGSKMNALVVGLLGGVICLIFFVSFLRQRSNESRDCCTTLLLMLAISAAVFITLNPVNYPNPVKGVWQLFSDQQRSLDVQKTIPAKRHPLHTPSERLSAIATLTTFHPVAFGAVVAAFLLQVLEAKRAKQRLPLIALWWVMAFLIVTAWLPFARPRYALPVIAPSAILVCGAGCWLIEQMRRKTPPAR